MYELLFIGAGPHCLTTLLRLLEPDADHSIDLSQRKTTPKSQVLRYWAKQRADHKYRQFTATWLKQNVAVIDPCGSWMGRWQQQFSGLQIKHLRSSSAVHPDPLDTYALVTYAGSHGRMDETLPLHHIHKTQYFHGPFHTPGAALFEDFCEDLVHRYCLDDLVTRDKVIGLTPVFEACNSTSSSSCGTHAPSSSSSSSNVAGKPLPHPVDHWLIQLESGQQLTARKVVIGIGSTNKMRIPAVLQQLQAVHLPSSSSDGISQPDVAVANTCDCCSTESSENSYSFVEWLPVDALAVSKPCIDKAPPSECGSSGSSAAGTFTGILCSSSSSSEGSWSSSSAASVISPNSTPDNSACGCDTCTESDGQVQSQKHKRGLLSCVAASTIAAAAAAALSATLDGSDTCAQPQQGCGTAAAGGGGSSASKECPVALASNVASVDQQLSPAAAAQASLVADAADADNSSAAAGTYPWGRMMHAWQLVEAVAAAAACDNPTELPHRARSSSSSKPGQQPTLQDLGLLNPGESVLIIGGGLTSAHLAQLAAGPWLANHPTPATDAAAAVQKQPKHVDSNSSVSSSCNSRADNCDSDAAAAAPAPVTLLLHGEWRVKQFDVDVPYMGRLRHKKLQEFGQLKSFTQRLTLIKQVLQGGSMPPEAAAWLQQLQSAGLLAVRQHSTVVAAEWDWQKAHWDIYLEDGDILHAHRLWLATGSEVNVSIEPIMQQLQQQLPIPIVAGLPAVQPTLEWKAGSGVHVLGAYAALQLGPGALNLAGAKTASVIMKKQLQRYLQGAASLHNSTTSSTVISSSSREGEDKLQLQLQGSYGAPNTDVQGAAMREGAGPRALDAAAVPAAAASAAFEADTVASAFRPCTALKGSDSIYLAGLASSHMELQRISSNSSNSSKGSAAVFSTAPALKYSGGSSTSGAGGAAGLAYGGDQCCGDCWKSRHIAAHRGWAARYSAVRRRY